jgi:hypothetical protein
MQIDGQCHCGRVTYQAEIYPKKVSICHCTDCQQLTGSPYRVTVICSAERVRMNGNAPKIYAKKSDNGRMRFQHFCGDCGSPIVRVVRTIGAFAGAVSVSAASSGPRGKSGAVPPYPGFTISRSCRAGLRIKDQAEKSRQVRQQASAI